MLEQVAYKVSQTVLQELELHSSFSSTIISLISVGVDAGRRNNGGDARREIAIHACQMSHDRTKLPLVPAILFYYWLVYVALFPLRDPGPAISHW